MNFLDLLTEYVPIGVSVCAAVSAFLPQKQQDRLGVVGAVLDVVALNINHAKSKD